MIRPIYILPPKSPRQIAFGELWAVAAGRQESTTIKVTPDTLDVLEGFWRLVEYRMTMKKIK